jgi:hypothetical protein
MFKLLKILLRAPFTRWYITTFLLKESGRDFLFKLGFLRSIKITKGEVLFEKKFCVFASFQPSGINELTIYYIKYLKEVMGFAVAFVSNCKISDADKTKLKPYCYEIMERANVGRDFGAYKRGILHYQKQVRSSELFLMTNDSVYGPIQDLRRLTEKMKQGGYDVFGDAVVDETIQPRHIPSYFILMNSKVVNNEKFWCFWKNKFKYKSTRKYIISGGEIAFSAYVFSRFYVGSFLDGVDILSESQKLTEAEIKKQYYSNKLRLHYKTPPTTNYIPYTNSLNHFPIIALKLKCNFIKKDWVKKVMILEFLVDEIQKTEFSTDIQKTIIIKELQKNAFMSKTTIRLIKLDIL